MVTANERIKELEEEIKLQFANEECYNEERFAKIEGIKFGVKAEQERAGKLVQDYGNEFFNQFQRKCEEYDKDCPQCRFWDMVEQIKQGDDN